MASIVDSNGCQHCYCQEDTGGNLYCCKCGEELEATKVITTPAGRVYIPEREFFIKEGDLD